MNNASSTQQQASNPEYSVFVSASAGTGKTKILVDRLLRLLLEGVSIDNILCITYSRAAAQEMINRLMNILAKWSIMNDNELQTALQELSNRLPNAEELNIAKQLFSKIINHPRELKIQTIHSFCQNLLARFPLEANIPPHFSVIEDVIAAGLKKQATDEIIEATLEDSQSSSSIENILSLLSRNISQFSFENIIRNILNYSEQLELISAKYKTDYSLDGLRAEIYKYLKANINLTADSILESYFLEMSAVNLKDCLKIFLAKNLRPSKLDVLAIVEFIEYPISKKIQQFETWKAFFLTKEEKPKQKILSKEVIAKLNGEENFILETIAETSSALLAVIEKIKAQASSEVNFAIMQLALAIYDRYQKLKYENGYLDFNDLIMKTKDLLNNPAMSAWIMYKLDQKIDHILVDESQDTSPMQWEIIKALIAEFFSGYSAKENNRTIFVVGDIKQSIYSFQGADPYSFSKTREFLKNKIENANKPFLQLAMNTSFRSSSGIINMVNCISKNLFDTTQIPYLTEDTNHKVFHDNKPASVEVWPLIFVDKDSSLTLGDKFQSLALAIVKKIEILHTDYGIAYGDILILYRKRQNNITLDYIVKLLKDRNIPVLGIDRINLKNNIAIQDMICTARFLSQPKDSFSLVCILKSPIFNLNDADIFNIIHYNSAHDAFNNLKYTHPQIHATLNVWLNMVDYKSVFDLFFHILYESTDGQTNISRFIQRLGLEVLDPLHEFMNLIFDFKAKNEDNLQSFLKFLENYDSAIKREISNNADSINLMSIHGSKGLQSKVVFLLNDLDNRAPRKDIMYNRDDNNPLLIIAPKKEIKSQTIKNLEDTYKNLDLDESKRLLYVAITRAEEHLYIASISNNEEAAEASRDSYTWFKAITANIAEVLVEEEDDFFNENLGFISKKVWRMQNLADAKTSNPPKTPTEIPQWVFKKAPVEPSPSKPLTPSRLIFEDPYFSSPLDILNTKILPLVVNKGAIIHKILEQINYIPKDDADIFMDNFLEQQLFAPADKEDIKQNINNIIKNPKFSFMFSAKNLNEVSLSGSVIENGILQMVSGRVDKLIILEKEIIVIDYKYSQSKKIMPAAYKRQINLYKSLLANIYKNHKISGFVLFTQTPELIEVLD
ncbi:MAG: UvrD-helicase domain-containing protein [Alphaproteobacteria bacterium]|nr:UvrD-helicase domain-containing protein [Alphaproteobacteria bacterium]